MRLGEGIRQAINMNLWRYLHTHIPTLSTDDGVFEESCRLILRFSSCLAEPFHQHLCLLQRHGLIKDGVLYLVSIVNPGVTRGKLLVTLIDRR